MGISGAIRRSHLGDRKRWLKIAAAAQLASGITPHVLRHSLASLAAGLGYSEKAGCSVATARAQRAGC